jgi:hypothetical protein
VLVRWHYLIANGALELSSESAGDLAVLPAPNEREASRIHLSSLRR